jgi:uncharacterized RDD family membrane protein YckC
MSCPSCGAELKGGTPHCAVCDALIAPPMEGALAPKPAPLRELPGVRKKEKTWRDEVNERVRTRRKKREEETGLPLFDQVLETASSELPPGASPSSPAPKAPSSPLPREAGRLEDVVIADTIEEAVADLPLRHGAREASGLETPEPIGLDETEPEVAPPPVLVSRPRRDTPATLPLPEPARERASPLVDDAPSSADEEWRLELSPPVPEALPLERPARFAERVRAGAVDLALLSLLGFVVVYFASRAARVPLVGLLPAWPWLLGYLAFLGIAYATYFTGTTGQTLGKMLFDLRVVDTAGQPPGYLRAMFRSALGALSVGAAGLGVLPIAFDPARRALHDRAFGTRVVRG